MLEVDNSITLTMGFIDSLGCCGVHGNADRLITFFCGYTSTGTRVTYILLLKVTLLRAWHGNHLKWLKQPKLRDQAQHEGHEGPVLFWLLIIVLLQYCFSSLDGYEPGSHTEFMMMRSGCIALSFMFSRNLPKFQSKELGQTRNCHLSCQQQESTPRVSLTPPIKISTRCTLKGCKIRKWSE